jgi:hypothetical protein
LTFRRISAAFVNVRVERPLIADDPVLRTPTILSLVADEDDRRLVGDAQLAVVTSSGCGWA